MDEAERIAREVHEAMWTGAKFGPDVWIADKMAIGSARRGIELGERESAAKIADMRRVLNEIATSACGRHTPDSDAAAQCLARNFPAPKPSLREAAGAMLEAMGNSKWYTDGIASSLGLARASAALRDALAREEGR